MGARQKGHKLVAVGRGGAPCRAGCAGRSEGREKQRFGSGPGNARGEVKAVMMLVRGRKARRETQGQSAAGKPEGESHRRSEPTKTCCARTVIAERAVAVWANVSRTPKALSVAAVPRNKHIQAVMKSINGVSPLQKVFIAFVYQTSRQGWLRDETLGSSGKKAASRFEPQPAAGYLTDSLTTASGGIEKKHLHEHWAARHTGEVIITYLAAASESARRNVL